MDADFAKYLRDFLKRYRIDSNNIDLNQVSDYLSIAKQATTSNIDLSPVSPHLKVIFSLHKNEVYIYQDDYKSSEKYIAIKDKWISFNNDDIMPIENYIEYFLIDRLSLIDLYAQESIYAMGNPYELDDEECRLADTLMTVSPISEDNEYEEQRSYPNRSAEIDDKIKAANSSFIRQLRREGSWISHKYKRAGGLVTRLSRDLHFHITAFPPVKEYKAEICKIIRFFTVLEHTEMISVINGKKSKAKKEEKNEPYFNITDFLSRPSMESTGKKFLRNAKSKRFNGKITDFIKNELEKEANLKENSATEINRIQEEFKNITDSWTKLFKSIHKAVDTNQKVDFDQMIRVCNSIVPPVPSYEEIKRLYSFRNPESENCSQKAINPYSASPIAALYFKILQFECLGEIEDRRMLNKIEMNLDYNAPQYFIEEMSTYKNQFVDRTNVEEHIKNKIEFFAKCVYPKSDIGPAEKKKISYHIKDVISVLECCTYAGKIVKSENEIPILLIISCLQAILLDEDDLEDEYIFYDYQHHLNSSHAPKISCKPAKKLCVAVQKLYWAQRVEAHWYANLGKFELYCKSKAFEERLYRILARLYSTDNIEEMRQYSKERYETLEPFFRESSSECQLTL